jgi:hypothetical protein
MTFIHGYREISGTESDEYIYLERPVIEAVINEKTPERPQVPKRKPPKAPNGNVSQT